MKRSGQLVISVSIATMLLSAVPIIANPLGGIIAREIVKGTAKGATKSEIANDAHERREIREYHERQKQAVDRRIRDNSSRDPIRDESTRPLSAK